ncbi:MAG: hypothetical protein ABI357_02015 [Granulicella sp.]
MKVLLTTAALVFATLPMLAQAGETGVSHPDQTPITVENNDALQQRPVPMPAATQPAMQSKPSAYVPYAAPLPPANAAVSTTAPARYDPDAEIVLSVPSQVTQDDSGFGPYRPYNGGKPGLTPRPAPVDIDADVVTSVPDKQGEMPEGTLLKVRMDDALSTRTTIRGSAFTATVAEDVQHDGRVVIPAGSVLDGMVTEVRGGRRISGRAAIHLEPRRVTLPDGTYYVLHAQVIDTGVENSVTVNEEGTILRRDHAVETLAIVSATTGSAAVAGALIGGGVGAAVGAGIGAGAGTILWLKQDRETALPKNTALVFSLTTPMMMHPMQDGAQLRP